MDTENHRGRYEFVPINEDERAIIEKSLERANQKPNKGWFKRLKSAYLVQGNFTIALLTDGKGLCAGVSKRCPRDKDMVDTALTISLARAARVYPVFIGRSKSTTTR